MGDTVTGLAFLLFPAMFAFGFAVHPGLGRPRMITNPAAMVARVHGNGLLHFGHVVVLASCPLLVAVAVHYASMLDGTSARRRA